MKYLLLAAGLLASEAVLAQGVDVGRGDWSRYPVLDQRGQHYLGDAVMDRIEQISRQGSCRVDGLNGEAVDLQVPAVMRLNDEGEVEQIVIQDLGCPELETVLGVSLQAFVAAGEYELPERAGWYRTEVQFANQ